jgi:uncharacterized protein
MTIEYHEPPQELSTETRDLHRAFATLVEELEAIDWYQHRLDVTHDAELRAVIKHNQDEEMEHAAMTLEWLRRKLPTLDAELRQYLFTETPIVSGEGHHHAGGDGGGPAGPSLGIGSLKRERG